MKATKVKIEPTDAGTRLPPLQATKRFSLTWKKGTLDGVSAAHPETLC